VIRSPEISFAIFASLAVASAEALELWPEVELELWKFISFPVSGRQSLLISGSTPPAELKQRMGKSSTPLRSINTGAQS
jgi:hypothetical protein